MLESIIFITIGFVLLIKGADFLVDGASRIAKRFNIPEIVIGLTIVAIGTSMPELVVSVTSTLEGHSDISIGNVVGSNITNMFLILGICSIIKPLKFKKSTRVFEIPFMIAITSLFFYFSINIEINQTNIITRTEGLKLLVLCVIFIIYNIFITKREEKDVIQIELGKNKKISVFASVFNIIIGVIGLKLGGDLVVDNAVIIAKIMGITENIISLTIIAFSTSLPELITSITATKRGETDMAIGNIIGSQIFNILLIIGTAAFLSPIEYSVDYNNDLILLVFGSIILWLFSYTGEKNKMTRKNGIIFFTTYVIYLITICVKNGM